MNHAAVGWASDESNKKRRSKALRRAAAVSCVGGGLAARARECESQRQRARHEKSHGIPVALNHWPRGTCSSVSGFGGACSCGSLAGGGAMAEGVVLADGGLAVRDVGGCLLDSARKIRAWETGIVELMVT